MGKRKEALISQNWQNLKMEIDQEKTSKNISKLNKKSGRIMKKGGSNFVVEHNKWKKRKDLLAAKLKETRIGQNDYSKIEKVKPEITNIVGMDCEYVGIGFEGREHQLARVSIVNADGLPIYDKYVRPTEPIVDYRTDVSGIRPGNLTNGEHFQTVQQEVHKLLADKIVVGHAVHNDFKVLGLTHPARLTRDTAKYKPLREMADQIQKMPSLKHLATHLLGVQIQQGEHDSITDAKMALRIYLLHRKKWDEDFRKLQNRKKMK